MYIPPPPDAAFESIVVPVGDRHRLFIKEECKERIGTHPFPYHELYVVSSAVAAAQLILVLVKEKQDTLTPTLYLKVVIFPIGPVLGRCIDSTTAATSRVVEEPRC